MLFRPLLNVQLVGNALVYGAIVKENDNAFASIVSADVVDLVRTLKNGGEYEASLTNLDTA